MRIAVYDPQPRICGVTTFAWVCCDGFRKLGHGCDVITVTKSGNPSAMWGFPVIEKYGDRRFADRGVLWYHLVPDRTLKLDTAAEELDRYDLILLAEPACPPQNKDAERSFDIPIYIQVLSETSTPFISHVHGPYYYKEYAADIGSLLDLKNFRGLSATHASYVKNPPWDQLPKAQTVLSTGLIPYTPEREISSAYPRTNVVGCTGRVVPNKGVLNVAVAAESVANPWCVEIWGSSSVGQGPCSPYMLFEYMCTRGWEGSVEMDEKTAASLSRTGSKPVLKPHPWELRKGDHVLRYRGGYVGLEASDHITVFCTMTSPTFQNELLEYTALEAIDAGCEIVSLRTLRNELTCEDQGFSIRWVEPCRIHGKVNSDPDPDTQAAIDDAIWGAIIDCGNEGARAARVTANREAIRRTNDPSRFCQQLLTLL